MTENAVGVVQLLVKRKQPGGYVPATDGRKGEWLLVMLVSCRSVIGTFFFHSWVCGLELIRGIHDNFREPLGLGFDEAW